VKYKNDICSNCNNLFLTIFIAGALEVKVLTYVPFVKCHTIIIRFVIPVVFIIKLDWGVCACLTQLYDGRDMYRIYYIKNNYMFRSLTLANIRLRNENT